MNKIIRPDNEEVLVAKEIFSNNLRLICMVGVWRVKGLNNEEKELDCCGTFYKIYMEMILQKPPYIKLQTTFNNYMFIS